MAWEVEYTAEFNRWWNSLTHREQDRIDSGVQLLIHHGPQLPFPHSSGVRSSRHSHMRELRVQIGGRPFRVFYAFDPRRTAAILVGGDKTGNSRFYRRYIPIADRLYDEHIDRLRRDGLIQ